MPARYRALTGIVIAIGLGVYYLAEAGVFKKLLAPDEPTEPTRIPAATNPPASEGSRPPLVPLIDIYGQDLPGGQCITNDDGKCLLKSVTIPATAPNTRVQVDAEIVIRLLKDQRKGDPNRQGGVFLTSSPEENLRHVCENNSGHDECADYRLDGVFEATTKLAVSRKFVNQSGAGFTVYLDGYTRDGTQMLPLHQGVIGTIKVTASPGR